MSAAQETASASQNSATAAIDLFVSILLGAEADNATQA